MSALPDNIGLYIAIFKVQKRKQSTPSLILLRGGYPVEQVAILCGE